MVYGYSLFSVGQAVASWVAAPSTSGPSPLLVAAQSPEEAERSLPGALTWSADAFAAGPLDSAVPASSSDVSLDNVQTSNDASGPGQQGAVSRRAPSTPWDPRGFVPPSPMSPDTPPRSQDHGFTRPAFLPRVGARTLLPKWRPRTPPPFYQAAMEHSPPGRWPQPATPESRDHDDRTLSGFNLPRPVAQPKRARPTARRSTLVKTGRQDENAGGSGTAPCALRKTAERGRATPLGARDANAVLSNGDVTITAAPPKDPNATVTSAPRTPRVATAKEAKQANTRPSRARLSPPEAIPLAASSSSCAITAATPSLPSAARKHSSSAQVSSSTPVRAASKSKRRLSPPAPLLSSSQAAAVALDVHTTTSKCSTPPRRTPGQLRPRTPPPSLPDCTISDEPIGEDDQDDDDDDTVRSFDAEVSQDVLQNLGMANFPALTIVHARPTHTGGRLRLPSLGLMGTCAVVKKATLKSKALPAKRPAAPGPAATGSQAATITAPAVIGLRNSIRPSSSAAATCNLGRSIRAGASLQARQHAIGEPNTFLAPIDEAAASAHTPTPVPAAATPARTPSTAPSGPFDLIAALEEMDRARASAQKKGAVAPGCVPSTSSAVAPQPWEIRARLARWDAWQAAINSASPDSSVSSASSSASSRKRPAAAESDLPMEVQPLNESLVQAFKRQRVQATCAAFRRQDALDRGFAPRHPGGASPRLIAPRRRTAGVPLRGAVAAPRLPPITVVKVNGAVVINLSSDTPVPGPVRFLDPVSATPPAAQIEHAPAADETFNTSSGSSQVSDASRSFSSEAARRSCKVKEAARRRVSEVGAVKARRERQERQRLQQESPTAQRQCQGPQQPTTPKRKTVSSTSRSPLRSSRTLVKGSALRQRLSSASKARSCSRARAGSASLCANSVANTALPVAQQVCIVVSSPASVDLSRSLAHTPCNSLLAAPQHAVSDRPPAQLVQPLEADWSSDSNVVRAVWSPAAGLGPGFEDESLENVFVTKCKPCDPTWFRHDGDGDVIMKDVADCTC